MLNPLWQPSATIEALKQRAYLMNSVRRFFQERNYLEVETPILAQHGVTDVYLANMKTTFRDAVYYLQTSPEYHMKRLLAAGSGPIFQITKVFRDDELGRWHNPEFTLLEWYCLNVDHHGLMDEVEQLLQTILNCDGMQRVSYQTIFQEMCDVDPFEASVTQLRQVLKRFGLEQVLDKEEQDIDQFLFLLMSHVIEPQLAQKTMPTAIFHFPPSQAALAKIGPHGAERFEVYFHGVELANGFHELTDIQEQKHRLKQDNEHRLAKGLPASSIDTYFLSALEHGLPTCSGVALGLDRLFLLAMQKAQLSDVLAFDIARA